MRRFGLIIAFCLLFQAVPTRADAWLGYILRLSGPGPFTGVDVNVRAICFGPRIDEKRLALLQSTTAPIVNPAARAVAAPDVAAALAEWQRLRSDFGLEQKNGSDLAFLQKLVADTPSEIETRKEDNVALSSTGVEISLCSATVKRRVSVDVQTGYWWSFKNDNDRQYANGERIKLTMLVPSISWRVVPNDRFDVVDVSTGGGAYWFSSKGFEGFHGAVLQPVRVEIHGPSSWAKKKWSESLRLLSIPTFSVGGFVFPAGFERAVFNPSTPGPDHIPAEFVWTFGVYANLNHIWR
jgi:hypothetical protein